MYEQVKFAKVPPEGSLLGTNVGEPDGRLVAGLVNERRHMSIFVESRLSKHSFTYLADQNSTLRRQQ